ncbi:hypothetical protein K445DRAFT_315759 [Daldinia sp. EC12]|nr:hypothetical protein K445DRAFT_315759 [Daldinia sp. EC12]
MIRWGGEGGWLVLWLKGCPQVHPIVVILSGKCMWGGLTLFALVGRRPMYRGTSAPT